MQQEYSNLLCLSASAGSGKTFKLVGRYLSLLFVGARANEILALTFTKKAALEMQDRIMEALREIALAPSLQTLKSDQLQELLKCGLSLEQIDKVRHSIYEEFLQGDVKIMTLDAFFGYILRKFCWYVGVSNHFESVATEDRDGVLELFLGYLNDGQKIKLAKFVAQENLDSFLAILDDLGMIYNELKETFFYKEVNPNAKEEAIECFYRFRELMLGQRVLNEKQTKALEADSIKSLMSRGKTWLTRSCVSDYRDFKKIALSSEIENTFLRLRECIKDVFSLEEADYLSKIDSFFKPYINAKNQWSKQNNVLSFQQVALRVYDLLAGKRLQTLSLQEFLYFRLDSRISHILIDEFQDTNLLQYDILKPLIAEICAGIGRIRNRSFFYVGDPKQSIYRFRGGRQELFSAVAKEFSMEVRAMEFNYRSFSQIVHFVNSVFSNHFKDYVQQIPKKTQQGFVSVESTTNPCQNALEIVTGLLKSGVRAEEIAILSLKNDRLEEMAQSLRELQINVVLETSAQIFDHISVRAILQALHYYANRANTLAKEEFWHLTHRVLEEEVMPSTLANRILGIMQKYGLSSASAQKFLEISLDYASLEELESKIPLLNYPMPSEDLEGVRLLSVHKSKGLEFPYVIVLDTKTRSKSKRLIYEYENLHLQEIYYNTSPADARNMRMSVDSGFKEALDKDTALESQEELNCLYVALTRAQKALFVIQLRKEDGELDGDFKILDLEKKTLGDLKSIPLEKKPTEPVKQDRTQRRAETVDLVGHNFGRQQEKVSLHKQTEINYHAIAWGNAMHYALELSIKDQLCDEEIFHLLLNRFGFFLKTPSVVKIVEQMHRALEYPPFRELLSRGEVHCETSFFCDSRENRIDVLVLGDNANYIIDYKSGGEREEYREQVSFYVENVTRITHKMSYGYIFYLGNSLKLQQVV